MTVQYYVRAVDLETGEQTGDEALSERSWHESIAIGYAERTAEEYFGGDEVTWFEDIGGGIYHVGRVLENGSRSDALFEITVIEEEEVEKEEDTETV